MVLRCPRCERSRHQLLSTQGKERTMLNAALGMLAMVPVVFGVAGYTMVTR
jgi:hypothetical protein